MYENIIVRINLKSVVLEMRPEQDYRDVIDKYTQEGWRFVQIFAPPIRGYGVAPFYDLIFEREKKDI